MTAATASPIEPDDRRDRQHRFMALLTPHYRYLESYALAMERDREASLDLVGETLLRAWERFDDLRDAQAFLSWPPSIARRLARDRRRRRFFIKEHLGHAALLLAETSHIPELSADVTALHTALARLPVAQREAIVLFELNGLSLQEVAQVQECSVGAVKVRLHRGRARLAVLLGATVDDVRHDADPAPANLIPLESNGGDAASLRIHHTILRQR
jgi:RNA polymerase sigma-70 factor (ECF subfamily)